MQYGGGGHRFLKVFHKIPVFFERWLPLVPRHICPYGCFDIFHVLPPGREEKGSQAAIPLLTPIAQGEHPCCITLRG